MNRKELAILLLILCVSCVMFALPFVLGGINHHFHCSGATPGYSPSPMVYERAWKQHPKSCLAAHNFTQALLPNLRRMGFDIPPTTNEIQLTTLDRLNHTILICQPLQQGCAGGEHAEP